MVDSLVVYRRLVAAQVRSQLQYRLSFALDLFGAFLISFLDFLAVLVIFHNIPRLAGWSVREVAFLYAASSISFALTDLTIGHLDDFPQKIRNGNFDVLLLRPRGTLFQVVASDFALRRLGKLAQALVVLAYALSGLHVSWDAGRSAMLVLMIPTGAVVFGAVWVTGTCLSFWTTEGGEFTNAFTYGGNYLHDPEVLFLDEPTIGLDVVAKERVREFLTKLNRERGVTVLLTTHDLADIERLCSRILMIDHGRLIYDGTVDDLIERYGAERTLVVDLEEPAPPLKVPGATVVRVDGPRQWLRFRRGETSAAQVTAAVAAQAPLLDLAIEEPDIEDVVRRIYTSST